jgi:hypothetical protein
MPSFFLLRVGFASAVLLAPVPASATDYTCDQTDSLCATPGKCYSAFWPDWMPPALNDGYCRVQAPSQPNSVELKFLPADPPATARLVCESVGNCTFSCTVFPHGSGITYAWSTSGAARLDSQPASNQNYASIWMINNNSGTVHVNVSSPFGQSTSAAWGIASGSCFPY